MKTDFYGVTAQVIPVLALVIVFEMRGLESKHPLRSRLYVALLVWGLAVALAFCLAALYTGKNPYIARAWVSLSMFGAGGFIVGSLLDPHLNELQALDSIKSKRWATVAVTVAVLLVVGLLPLYLMLKLFDVGA